MKWKNRLTNYNFWISIVSAVLLILQNFDVHFDIANFNEIVTGVLGLLVVIGIINDPTKSSTTNENSNKSKGEIMENLENTITNQQNNETKIEENEFAKTNAPLEEHAVDQQKEMQATEQEELLIKATENEAENKIVAQTFKTPISAENENDVCPVETTDEVFVDVKNETDLLLANNALKTEQVNVDEINGNIETAQEKNNTIESVEGKNDIVEGNQEMQTATEETETISTTNITENKMVENLVEEEILLNNNEEAKVSTLDTEQATEEGGANFATSFGIVN